jgi:hypothetical protein
MICKFPSAKRSSLTTYPCGDIAITDVSRLRLRA